MKYSAEKPIKTGRYARRLKKSKIANFCLLYTSSPSEPSLPSKNSSPGLTNREQPEQKPSVKKELQEIKQEQVKKKEEKAKQQDRQHPTPGHSRKKKKKQKGR